MPKPSLAAGEEVPPPPRLQREDPGASPQRLAKNSPPAGVDDWRRAKADAQGKGYEHDHGRPRSAEERLRNGVPYSEPLCGVSCKASLTPEYKWGRKADL